MLFRSVALLESIQEEFSRGRGNYIDSKSKSLDENIKGFFEQKKDDILINKKMEYAQIDYWVQSTVNEEMRDIFKKKGLWGKNAPWLLYFTAVCGMFKTGRIRNIR